MKKIEVISTDGYGGVETNIGKLTWDFDTNGVDGILIDENNQIYKIISDERDSNDEVTVFFVE